MSASSPSSLPQSLSSKPSSQTSVSATPAGTPDDDMPLVSQASIRFLMERGCTEDEARQAIHLLLGMGVPPEHLEAWVHDLMSLVKTAFDAL